MTNNYNRKHEIKNGDTLYKYIYNSIGSRHYSMVGFEVHEVSKVNKTTFKVKGSNNLYNLSDLYKRGSSDLHDRLYTELEAETKSIMHTNAQLFKAHIITEKIQELLKELQDNIEKDFIKEKTILDSTSILRKLDLCKDILEL